MTEAEWLASTDPEAMLEFLRGRASDRKLLLLASACARDAWAVLEDEVKAFVGQTERHAEGELSRAGWVEAVLELVRHHYGGEMLVERLATVEAWEAAWVAVRRPGSVWLAGPCHLLRDIFGPLPLPPLAPSLLAWNDGLLRRLAQAAYDERLMPSGHLDVPRLAVLADTLLDASCTDAELLKHLRSEGPHVRGCWAARAAVPQTAHILGGRLIWSRLEPYDSPGPSRFMEQNEWPAFRSPPRISPLTSRSPGSSPG